MIILKDGTSWSDEDVHAQRALKEGTTRAVGKHLNFFEFFVRVDRQPNLQNMPVRTELGRQIREAFFGEVGPK